MVVGTLTREQPLALTPDLVSTPQCLPVTHQNQSYSLRLPSGTAAHLPALQQTSGLALTLAFQTLVGGQTSAKGTKNQKPKSCSWQEEAVSRISCGPSKPCPQCQARGPTCQNRNVPNVDTEAGLGEGMLWGQWGPQGWGCDSGSECLSTVRKVPGSIPAAYCGLPPHLEGLA